MRARWIITCVTPKPQNIFGDFLRTKLRIFMFLLNGILEWQGFRRKVFLEHVKERGID